MPRNVVCNRRKTKREEHCILKKVVALLVVKMGGGELSEFQRGTVVGCHLCKKSVREISAMLDLPRSAVISVLLKWKREGATTALPRRGRPHKLKEEGRDGAEMESALPSVCALTASGAKVSARTVQGKLMGRRTRLLFNMAG